MRVMVTVRGTTEEAQAIKELFAMRLEAIGRTRIVGVDAIRGGQTGRLRITASMAVPDAMAGVIREMFRVDIERGRIEKIETEDDGYGRQQSMFDR